MLELAHTARRLSDRLSNNRLRLQRIGLAVAALGFAVGLVWSIWAFPEALTLDAWPLAILLFLGVPLMTALNAAELHVMSRVAGVSIGWPATLEATVYGSAANILPIPGSVIARIVALRAGGATVGVGTMITVLFAGISGGMVFCYSGAWLIVLGHQALGGIFSAAGVSLLGMCFFAALRLKPRKSLLARAFAIRAVLLFADTLRQMLAIWSLGALIGFGEASVLTISSFVGSVLSFVPAGLGLREIVTAALSPLIALPPAVGFLSVAVNRIVDMVGLAVLSAVLFIRRRDAAEKAPKMLRPGS